jgi:glycosyltransferase involved in cell wall biosynthesis
MILYVRSERAAFATRMARKPQAIHETWRSMGFDVEMVNGGDVLVAGGEEAEVPNDPGRFTSEPRMTGALAPLQYSMSEWRDLRHDRQLLAHLRERTRQRKPEMIWHRASRLHRAPLRIAQELGVPYVLEWIDSLVAYRYSLFRSLALAADRERMREAFRVVVVSEAWKRSVTEEYGVPAERIEVAHNAVYPAAFARNEPARVRIRAKLGVPDDALVVGFVGSYARFHQTHLVAEAAAHLRDRGVESVYWLMVGDGPMRAEFDAQVDRLGMNDRIFRQGRVASDEVAHWLSAMDAAVMMSIGGDIICPIKVPEYMAAGLAPVIADTPATREVVEEGRTGTLFRPDDSAAMADAVERLAATPGLARRLGFAACEEVTKRFTWTHTWGAALERIAADVRGGSA